jgi:ABC-2 type transport system permease protein
VLGLLYVPVIALGFLPEHLRELAQRYAPRTAGLAVQVTTGRLELVAGQVSRPIGPLAGLGVLAACAASALAAAFWLVGRRDA